MTTQQFALDQSTKDLIEDVTDGEDVVKPRKATRNEIRRALLDEGRLAYSFAGLARILDYAETRSWR